MNTHRIQVALQGKLGLPKQQFMNTFHCDAGAVVEPGDPQAFAEAIRDFYITGANGVDAAWAFLSNAVATDDHRITVYDLSDPEPRAPVYEMLFDLPGALSVEGYPSEVALACSYSADVVSRANMARRRGRFFFGPLKNTAGDLVGNVIRPVPAIMDCLRANMEQLMEDIEAIGTNTRWVVYSPTAGQSYPVTHGWVDNAFDTVRRRGEDATARVVWP